MIRNFIYYIILLNILIISCNKKDDKNSKTNIRLKRLNVNIDDIPKTTLNELCPTIDLIPLETKKNVLLTNALYLEVDFYQDKIYIFDREQRDCLFIYNRDGKFIKKFSKQGRGPGEYMGISDFEINPFNNNLEILQADGQYYTYDSSGNFLRKVSILNDSIRATHKFANVSEDIVVFYTMAMNNRLIFYSKKESKIIRHIFKVPESTIKNTNLRMIHKPFTRWKGMLFFHEIFYFYTRNYLFWNSCFWSGITGQQ